MKNNYKKPRTIKRSKKKRIQQLGGFVAKLVQKSRRKLNNERL